MKKRENRLFIRVTDEERNRILDKMYGMGIHSLSAYIRKMALDGYCLCLDLKELRRMAYLLQNCSNNLNQVAKRANESGQIYAADLDDLRIRLDVTHQHREQIFPTCRPLKFFRILEVYLLLTSLQSWNRYLYNKGRKERQVLNMRFLF